MGIVITCECDKMFRSQNNQVPTNINQIIINSKEEYNNQNNNSRNTQYTNSISNSNFSLNQNYNSIITDEKNCNYKKPSNYLKSKFSKNNTEMSSNNLQIKVDNNKIIKVQTENKNKMNRRSSYVGHDLLVSHEVVSKNISKIEKTFHSNLLESLKEIEENEKELNDRLERKKFQTKKFRSNNQKSENKEDEKNENNENNEDEIFEKEDVKILRTNTIQNNKSRKFKSTGELMFSGLNLNDVYEIRGFFQLKKNINFKFYGKKEIDGTKNSFGIIKWEDGSKLTTIFKNSKINNYGIFKDTNNLNNIEETSYFYGYELFPYIALNMA
jgi:hypothetical protein